METTRIDEIVCLHDTGAALLLEGNYQEAVATLRRCTSAIKLMARSLPLHQNCAVNGQQEMPTRAQLPGEARRSYGDSAMKHSIHPIGPSGKIVDLQDSDFFIYNRPFSLEGLVATSHLSLPTSVVDSSRIAKEQPSSSLRVQVTTICSATTLFNLALSFHAMAVRLGGGRLTSASSVVARTAEQVYCKVLELLLSASVSPKRNITKAQAELFYGMAMATANNISHLRHGKASAVNTHLGRHTSQSAVGSPLSLMLLQRLVLPMHLAGDATAPEDIISRDEWQQICGNVIYALENRNEVRKTSAPAA